MARRLARGAEKEIPKPDGRQRERERERETRKTEDDVAFPEK